MNRSEMATAVRRTLNDFSTEFISTSQMYDALHEAAQELNEHAEVNRANTTVNLADRTREYSLSGGVMDIYRVRLGTGSSRRKLEPLSVAAFDRNHEDWESGTAGTPSRYYWDGSTIGFDPYPTSTVAAATVYMRVLKDVPAFSNATSTPSWCPDRYHRTIVKKAAINLAGGPGADTDTNAVRLQKLYAEYLKEADKLKGLVRNRSREYQQSITPIGYGRFRR